MTLEEMCVSVAQESAQRHGSSIEALVHQGYEVRVVHNASGYRVALYSGGRYHLRYTMGKGSSLQVAALQAHAKLLAARRGQVT